MARLEDQTMAKMRSRMLHSDLGGLLNIMREIKTKCKGGNEHMDYTSSLLRDLYAYSIVHWFSALDCSVFGGFVTSHISGKVWDDIDIMTATNMIQNKSYDTIKIAEKLVKYMRYVFSLTAPCILVEPIQHKAYAETIKLCFVVEKISFQISIDLIDPQIAMSPFIPVSLGRCLKLYDRCISMRRIANIGVLLCSWECEDILSLLREGKDIGLCMHHSLWPIHEKKKYSEYFWTRIKKMQNIGYEIDDFFGEKPPLVGDLDVDSW